MEMVNIDNKNIDQLLSELDAGSRAIILYLLWNKHAKLDELTEVLRESSQMNTLVRIKEVINPKSLMILKRPILEFRKSYIDIETGKNILFSWWLAKRSEERVELNGNELSEDIFDEKKEMVIIMELPGVREEDIKLEIGKRILKIFYRYSGCNEYVKEIFLPCEVNPSIYSKKFQNQMLTIKISKDEGD